MRCLACARRVAAGASGYLLKADHIDTIIRGITEVLDGGAPLNSHIARMILATFNAVPLARPDIDLTERERETLALLGKLQEFLGLKIDDTPLRVAAAEFEERISALVAADPRLDLHRGRRVDPAGRRPPPRRSRILAVLAYAGIAILFLVVMATTFLLVAPPVDIVRERARASSRASFWKGSSTTCA